MCILFIDYMFKLFTIQTFLLLSGHLLLQKHLTTSTEFLSWGEHLVYLFIHSYLVNYDMSKFPSGIICLNPEDNTAYNGSCHASGTAVSSLTFCMSEKKKKKLKYFTLSFADIFVGYRNLSLQMSSLTMLRCYPTVFCLLWFLVTSLLSFLYLLLYIYFFPSGYF